MYLFIFEILKTKLRKRSCMIMVLESSGLWSVGKRQNTWESFVVEAELLDIFDKAFWPR